MSRITKLPMPSSKENRPGLLNRVPAVSASAKTLSDGDKKALLANHTKPWLRTGASHASTMSLPNKRPTAPPARVAPAKHVREEPPKPKTVPKITSKYDFKARFENLLEKHKAMRSEHDDLKQQQEEMSDECEALRSAAAGNDAEIGRLTTRLTRALADLKTKTEEYDRTAADLEVERCANAELRRRTELLAEVSAGLESKSRELERLEGQHASLQSRHEALAQETEALRVLTQHLKTVAVAHDALKLQHAEVKEQAARERARTEWLQNMLSTMHKEQRDLRNAVQDLKGNIRVYCRVRPTLPAEEDRPLFNINFVDACSVEVEKVELNGASASTRKGRQAQAFTFDGVFTPHVSQSDVFAEVAPLVQSALDGYNVCIFAYGQTGSGKTYTMEGGAGDERHGIIPRAFDMIFTYAEDLRRMGWELTVTASFLEIYNENIYDLLDSCKRGEGEQHDIKMSDARGGDVYVTNLREQQVNSSHELIRLLLAAQRNRATAATVNNERSSRSHAVTRVRISAVNERRKEKFTSHLNLVDLAGSESGKTTQRMTETCNINKSLSELKNVIVALRGNASHVPYRNSKLTYLLMPSLGGNSKALMLVNVCRLEECFAETLNSLRFAVQVNSCRTVKAKKNITVVET